jgi:TrmH RNA methyltransferase
MVQRPRPGRPRPHVPSAQRPSRHGARDARPTPDTREARPSYPTRDPHDARHPRGAQDAGDAAETVQGLRAGLAVFGARPDDVLRVAFSREVRGEVTELARWAAAHGVPCEERAAADLDRIAGGAHHEGLCVLARPRAWIGANDLADRLLRGRGTCVALDRVRNPYNVGAVLRSAAFFGVDAALLGAPAPHPGLAPTAVRVAEGGVEHLALARTTDLADTLERLRARGAKVVGADGHAEVALHDHRFERPAVLVLGNEREGLGPRIRAQCDAVVAIRGGGAVESLNVAVAAGVLIAAMAAKGS